jgi:3-oxoacyl-[acyl-carrier protein] reductase
MAEEAKAALVTGAGAGIGRATALELARRGMDIAVLDVNGDSARETAALVAGLGRRAVPYAVDVSDVEAAQEAVRVAERELDGLAVLVNNAGVSSDRCPLEQVTVAMFERSIAVHVRGTVFVTQAALPAMKERRRGKIVNISSIQALVGWAEGATYNAAKGAILALSKGWAKEFAPWRINVNVVAPGHTATEMTVKNDPPELRRAKAETIPLGRYAQPEEIAQAIAFLAGGQADFITGQVLSPNGGFTIT